MKNEKTILQLALDFTDVHRVLKIIKKAIAGGVDWIEIGTPLIKSEGVNAIRIVKKTFPEMQLVADMKTMDTGA